MTGILIPLYVYPTDASWKEVARAQRAYPFNPILTVINPDSGPGTQPDQFYEEGIKKLKRAGVVVLGYIATTYGAKLIDAVAEERAKYFSWYGLGDFFYDEVKADFQQRDYYSTIGAWQGFSVGNSGVMIPDNYVGLMDNFVIYEGPFTNVLSTSTTPLDPKNFSAIIHSQPSFSNQISAMCNDTVNYVYLTNGVEPNPYNSVPWIWEMLAALFVKSRLR